MPDSSLLICSEMMVILKVTSSYTTLYFYSIVGSCVLYFLAKCYYLFKFCTENLQWLQVVKFLCIIFMILSFRYPWLDIMLVSHCSVSHLMSLYPGFFCFVFKFISMSISFSSRTASSTDCHYVYFSQSGIRSCPSALQQYFETISKRHYSSLLLHRLKTCSHLGTAQLELKAKSGLNLSKEWL